MSSRLAIIAKVVAVLIFSLVFNPVRSQIIEISIPFQSQSSLSRPWYDTTWDVAASGGALDVNRGIGIIVNPIISALNDAHEFPMHQDSIIPPSLPYLSNNYPDPAGSTVTFIFKQPTVIRYIDVVQHIFGVTQLSGAIGNNFGAMSSLGSVFGPAGDITSGEVTSTEGATQRFDFGNTSHSGTIFQLTVSKSSLSTAYAFYRAYLYDQNGQLVAAAVPEPATWFTLIAGLALVAIFLRRSGRLRRR